MSNVRLIAVYLAMAVFFLLIEYLWIGVLAKDFYHKELSNLMAREVNLFAAVPLYLIYVTGIVIFAVLPSQSQNSLTKALLLGSLLGFFAYGTFNLTNLMILRYWPLSIIIVDMAWGTLLTCIISAIGYIMAQKISGI